MASFASSATTCGARKHAWTNTQNMVETKFQLQEFPRSGSKAEDVEREKERRAKVNDYKGKYIRLNQNYRKPFPVHWIF